MSSILIDKIRRKYGDGFADVIDKVTHDPDFSTSLIDVTSAVPNPDQALNALGQICAGKAPLSGAADALGAVTATLSQAANVPAVSAKAGPVSRPREDGLPEALTQAIALKQRHGFVLSAFALDPAVWQPRTERIVMLRSWLAWAQDFSRAVYTALGAEETAAERELRESFGTVRSVVLKNIGDKEHALISDYLYGSAEQGAQRTKENAAQRQELTEQARTQVSLETRRDARSEATRDLTSLLHDLNNPPEEAPATAPVPPSRSRPR